MQRRVLHLLVVAGIVGTSSGAIAAQIGVNFTGGGNGSSPAVSLVASDSAGVVPQINWNNAAGGTGTSLPLLDNTGAATAAALTYTAGGTYSSIGGAAIAPAGGDEKLNTGFVFGNGNVTVSGIPYATYDVYVYELNDAAGRVETTTLTAPVAQGPIFGGSATPNDAGHVDQSAGTSYVYTRSTSTDTANPTANGDYVRFTNVTGPTFTFTTSATGNGYLNGFQIVQVPEPASAGMLVTGVMGLLVVRRRTRAL